MYKYCLFDLDGTLTDPKEGICKSAQYGLHKMGIEEPDIDKLEPFIGPPLKDSYMDFYDMTEEDALKAVAFYRERFSVVGLFENQIYPGIAELLKKLCEKGMKLAIASSKPTVFVEKILEHFKIKKYFDVIVGSELDGTRSKKSEVINEALSQLLNRKNTGEKIQIEDSVRKQIVMIGDRKFDIEGAIEFGVDSIGVSYGYGGKSELKRAGATYVVATVKELETLLSSDNSKKKLSDEMMPPLPEMAIFRVAYALVPFALFYCVMLAVVSVCKIIYEESIRNNNQFIRNLVAENPWMLVSGISGLSMLIGAIVMLVTYSRTDPLKISFNKNLIMSLGAGLCLGVGLNLAFGFITMKLPQLAKESSISAKDVPLWAGIIIFVLISPVAEELVFRYLVYGRMRRFMGKILAPVFSSLFFGVYHGSLLQGIYAFIMGMIMVYMYEWSANLMSSIAFHVAANAIVFQAMKFEIEGSMAVTVNVCIITIIVGSILVHMFKKDCMK